MHTVGERTYGTPSGKAKSAWSCCGMRFTTLRSKSSFSSARPSITTTEIHPQQPVSHMRTRAQWHPRKALTCWLGDDLHEVVHKAARQAAVVHRNSLSLVALAQLMTLGTHTGTLLLLLLTRSYKKRIRASLALELLSVCLDVSVRLRVYCSLACCLSACVRPRVVHAADDRICDASG